MKGISIILCCHNSSDKIGTTLEYLARLQMPDSDPVELILVDNVSNDNIKEVVSSQWAELGEPFSLRLTEEALQGQVFARSKGVQGARYDLIVFCDDDNHLDDNYLIHAKRIMDQYPKVGALGGKGVGVSSSTLPSWFDDTQSAYACGEQFNKTGFCTKRMYLWGAGMISRKQILEKVFNSDYPLISSGRKGGVLSSGDDVEICMRIILQGYDLYYDNSLIFEHFINEERLTKEYLNQLKKGMSKFTPIKRLYAFTVLKTITSSAILPLVFLKDGALYMLLKMKLIPKQRFSIVNIFKVYLQGIRKKGEYHGEYLGIRDFAKYARSSF